MVHYKFDSDLKFPFFQAIHEGRVCLVGTMQRKRIIRQGVRGGLYVKMAGKKQYLSNSGIVVITNGTRENK